jgi:hypothetical protein
MIKPGVLPRVPRAAGDGAAGSAGRARAGARSLGSVGGWAEKLTRLFLPVTLPPPLAPPPSTPLPPPCRALMARRPAAAGAFSEPCKTRARARSSAAPA